MSANKLTFMDRLQVINTAVKELEKYSGLSLELDGGTAGKKGHWFAIREKKNLGYITEQIIGIRQFLDTLQNMTYLAIAMKKHLKEIKA